MSDEQGKLTEIEAKVCLCSDGQVNETLQPFPKLRKGYFSKIVLTIARSNIAGDVSESNDSFTTWIRAGLITTIRTKRDLMIGCRSQDLGVICFTKEQQQLSRLQH